MSTKSKQAPVEIESAQVTVQIEHQRWGDLIIKLISPSGTESILLNRMGKQPGSADSERGSTQSGLMNYSFNTTHVRGEQSGGAWKLQVIDAATGSTGTLKNWKLDLYGSTADEDETNVYTDEFGSFSGTERATLADSNGGKDILNASAVSTGSQLNLNSGAVSIIAGKTVTMGSGIEFAYGGDGDDTITGSSVDNFLQGGRGNDIISASAGDDVIQGGQGANTLTGSAGADIFMVKRYAGAVDTITDFEVGSDSEKIALVGFPNIDDFTKLVITLEGSDSRVALGDGQSIVVKGVQPSQLSEQNFSFFSDVNHFVNYSWYRSSPRMVSGTFTSGNDGMRLSSPSGTLQAYGQAGDDRMLSRSQKDLLDGGNGNDSIWGEYVDIAGGYPDIPAGADWIEGGAGADVLRGGGDKDSLFGGSGNDELYGEDGDDELVGASGQDYLVGGQGNDTITLDGDIGSASATSTAYYGTRVGGAGTDVFKVLPNATGNATVNVSGGIATVRNLIADFETSLAGETIDLTALDWIRGFSDLTLTDANYGTGLNMARVSASRAGNVLTLNLLGVSKASLNANHFKFAPNPGFVGGTSNADTLTGDAGGNTLDGGPGADKLVGRTGDDIYIVDNTGDVIEEQPGGGFDVVTASADYTLSAEVENLTLTGSANTNATGNAGRNLLRGNAGNNRMDGGAEADDMRGGLGDDTYVVDNQLDTPWENTDQGNDTVESSVSWSLASDIENVTLTGTASINAAGNNLNNKLVGNVGNNVLDGAQGNDSMDGGAGDDTYFIDASGDVVTENADAGNDTVYVPFTYSLIGTPNIENAWLYGSAAANLIGNDFNNLLVGNSAANTLTGGEGNDSLNGDAGADVMNGGGGDDSYTVDDAGDQVNENDGGGNDFTLVANVSSYTLRPFVENGARLTSGTLIGNDLGNALNGSSGADTLRGEGGADTLIGGRGNDQLIGGAGDDTYIVDSTGDVIVELVEADGFLSYDSILSSVTYTAPDNVEAITLTGSDNINATANNTGCDLTGNIGNNYLKGGDSLDFIFGDEGIDTLEGGAGDDYYYLVDNSDTVIEQVGGGLDQIWAYGNGIKMADNVERLYMKSFLAISAYGNEGKNYMMGNNRNNTLYGYGGADQLFGLSGDDSFYGSLGNDTLYGSQGNDTYHFLRGDGADAIVDTDGTVGNKDTLALDGTINANQVWFARSGSNLVVSVIGTTDQVTINNWFVGVTYQVESFMAAGNGKTLSSAQVQGLVDAMANFTTPTAGQTTLPANYQTALNTVIASSWV